MCKKGKYNNDYREGQTTIGWTISVHIEGTKTSCGPHWIPLEKDLLEHKEWGRKIKFERN